MIIVDILKNGGIGVIPTDTIYGIVCSAINKKSVEKLYKLRKRNPKKPFIILISSINDLKLFNVKPNVKIKNILKNIWPNKVSVILPCPYKKFSYLHRGTKTLAFRMPAKKELIDLIKKVGPISAPSANPEGQKPASNIKEAIKYFGDKVDFYVDGKEAKNIPSTLIKLDKKGDIEVLRQGAAKISI
ncbi:MAG: L-threonylcarbamoyladenylate synthase [Candidatus Paceibacterota bacterium]|jgi:L-threonylcarbamoyladenylate synthase